MSFLSDFEAIRAKTPRLYNINIGSENSDYCTHSDKNKNCTDCNFCYDCVGCKNCFGCVGLQNKEFYILNQPYPREEYFKKVTEIKAQMRAEGSYGKQLHTTYKYEDTAAIYWK